MTDRQTDGKDRHTDRQADRQTDGKDRQTDRQKDRQTGGTDRDRLKESMYEACPSASKGELFGNTLCKHNTQVVQPYYTRTSCYFAQLPPFLPKLFVIPMVHLTV